MGCDLFRSIVFISVSIITIILSEQIEKSRILLESSENSSVQLLNPLLKLIITTDESGKVIFVNKSFEKIFGYAEDEIIGKTFEIIMPPQYREKHGKIFTKLKEKNEDEYFNKTLELTASRKDGTEFPFEMSITSWKVNNQKFITAILRDISERKKAEKTQNILSAIVDGSDDAIIGKDIEGNILSWNHGAEIIYGYKAEEVIGKSVSILFPQILMNYARYYKKYPMENQLNTMKQNVLQNKGTSSIYPFSFFNKRFQRQNHWCFINR